jgi:hypothetical protein
MVMIKVGVLYLQEPLQTLFAEFAELKLEITGFPGLGHNTWGSEKCHAGLNSDSDNCERDQCNDKLQGCSQTSPPATQVCKK